MRPEEVVKANTKEAFDAFYAADEYIATRYLEPQRLALYDLVADYCAAAQPPAVECVLDVGCGMGHMLAAIQRRCATAELVGLDFSAVGIARARALLPTATFMVKDLYQGLPSGFDLVLCVETLEHLRDPSAAMMQIMAACVPGGHAVLTVPNGDLDSWDGHRNFWSPAALRDYLRPWGLRHLALWQNDTVLLADVVKE